jgi:hypothetical protein
MVRSGVSLLLVTIHIHVASSALYKKDEVPGSWRRDEEINNFYCLTNIVTVKDDEMGVTCSMNGIFVYFVKYIGWETSRKEHSRET